jgi:penicillin-binding protein 2
VIAGIGQGYWAVTPLQLGHAMATLAGHGMPYLPRLVMATRASWRCTAADAGESAQRSVADPEGFRLERDQRRHAGGDYRRHRQGTEYDGFPYLIAGKSGTAERFSRTSEAYNTNKNSAHLAARHRAWFEAYTPADDPKIAAAAVLESGAWGAKDAGPIVRKIFDAWLVTQGSTAPVDTPSRRSSRAASS